ncbi:hypothetical protein HDK90DRAFT_512346 [Phyllosticta capitalensis]|uniref:Uncharacterized protein n=1 Tax=Phyllosticta capitalensis TaxID=121624 RepID=A0ABR1YM95_9PEZI
MNTAVPAAWRPMIFQGNTQQEADEEAKRFFWKLLMRHVFTMTWITEREKADIYSDFFRRLLDELRNTGVFETRVVLLPRVQQEQDQFLDKFLGLSIRLADAKARQSKTGDEIMLLNSELADMFMSQDMKDGRNDLTPFQRATEQKPTSLQGYVQAMRDSPYPLKVHIDRVVNDRRCDPEAWFPYYTGYSTLLPRRNVQSNTDTGTPTANPKPKRDGLWGEDGHTITRELLQSLVQSSGRKPGDSSPLSRDDQTSTGSESPTAKLKPKRDGLWGEDGHTITRELLQSLVQSSARKPGDSLPSPRDDQISTGNGTHEAEPEPGAPASDHDDNTKPPEDNLEQSPRAPKRKPESPPPPMRASPHGRPST